MSSGQAPASVKGTYISPLSHTEIQCRAVAVSLLVQAPFQPLRDLKKKKIRNGSLGLKMKSDICLCLRQLRHMRDYTRYLKKTFLWSG